MKTIGMICVVVVAVLFTLIACEEEYEIGDTGSGLSVHSNFSPQC